MTRLGFAAIALILVVFGEIESTRSISRFLFVLGGIPVAFFFERRRPGHRNAPAAPQDAVAAPPLPGCLPENERVH